jgi:hypothetical protein
MTMDVYSHDWHQIAVVHQRSGMVALASRVDVECARADEIRTGFTTSFISLEEATRNLRDRSAFPRGEQLTTPSAEALAWREAVVATLDAFAAMTFGDRYFTNIQRMWSEP